ncbi:MAG TPA: hypothetical protein VL201_00185 [Patescibacteria group bacterium]|jgi:hypothetical protein|nr:hypothetical protein [Patescibacteria group bacterium]
MKNQTILCLLLACLLQNSLATVSWSGTNVHTVVDENINIIADCFLDDPFIYVVAEGCDVTVTVKKSLLIQAQANTQAINFVAVWPYTITVKVEHDLEFRGVENIETEPLSIYMFGDGEVRWEVNEDKKLKFNKTNTSGATEIWIGLFDGGLRHIFKSSDKKQIFFGPECLIGYAVAGSTQWTTNYEVQSGQYNAQSSKDYPRIKFDEGSQLAVEVQLEII